MLEVAGYQHLCASGHSHFQKRLVVSIGQCRAQWLGADSVTRGNDLIEERINRILWEPELWTEQNVTVLRQDSSVMANEKNPRGNHPDDLSGGTER